MVNLNDVIYFVFIVFLILWYKNPYNNTIKTTMRAMCNITKYHELKSDTFDNTEKGV